MVWKCPKCKYTTSSYKAMSKHYYAKHYKSKAKGKGQTKGKAKKRYTFKPRVGKR